ncbi:MAG: transcriptional repressor [Deltaproteobacteria bacterium]|nr:MAG: transcriptional repressor [Deltaproteobacteria bacterium]
MLITHQKAPGEETLRALLREHGLSPTVQRVAIARFVLGSADHPTAEDVFMGVREGLDGVSQATVYNTLNRLVECRIINQFQRTGERVRYDGNTTPHHHFFDVEEGTLHDLDQALVAIELDPALLEHVEASDVRVVIEGRRRKD